MAPLQIYEYTEPQIQKGLLFRSSGDFEMQFEDIRIDKLNLAQKIEESSRENKSFGEDSAHRSSHQSGSYDPDFKLGKNVLDINIESGDLISTKFKPEIK